MIKAGDITMGATLYQPQNALGDLPGIVIVHGSGRVDRRVARFYTFRAFKMGFAVLVFDKRGVGESSGEYIPFAVETSEETFNDLANDVAYAVRWLAKRPGIDTNRIGVFGGSQAGWIMPLTASKEPLVKFIIAGEGPSVTAGEESIHGRVTGDGTRGWNAEDISGQRQIPILQKVPLSEETKRITIHFQPKVEVYISWMEGTDHHLISYRSSKLIHRESS